MELVYTHILMERDMKANGRMINKKEMEKNFGLMVPYMKVNIKMVRKMDMVNLHGQMGLYTLAILRIII